MAINTWSQLPIGLTHFNNWASIYDDTNSNIFIDNFIWIVKGSFGINGSGIGLNTDNNLCVLSNNGSQIHSLPLKPFYNNSINSIDPDNLTMGDNRSYNNIPKDHENFEFLNIKDVSGTSGFYDSQHQTCVLITLSTLNYGLCSDDSVVEVAFQKLYYNGSIYIRSNNGGADWNPWQLIFKDNNQIFESKISNINQSGSYTGSGFTLVYQYNYSKGYHTRLRLDFKVTDWTKLYTKLQDNQCVAIANLTNLFDTTGSLNNPNVIAFLKYLYNNNQLPQSSGHSTALDAYGNIIKIGMLGDSVNTDSSNNSVASYATIMVSPLMVTNRPVNNVSINNGLTDNSNNHFVFDLTADGFDSTIAK